jgi:hypothetical protein
MKTDELINTLVADHAAQPRPRPIGHRLVVAIIGGLLISGALFSLTLGVRPDILSALGTWRFDFKWAEVVALVIAATWVALQLSRPTATLGYAARPLVLPAILTTAAVTLELVIIPPSAWLSHAAGMNGLMCLANILFLSVLPFAAVLFALREGAPASPAFVGAAAGLLAGALASTAYVMHCTEDSPLFVAVWYTLAIGLLGCVGLLLGQYLLRW